MVILCHGAVLIQGPLPAPRPATAEAGTTCSYERKQTSHLPVSEKVNPQRYWVVTEQNLLSTRLFRSDSISTRMPGSTIHSAMSSKHLPTGFGHLFLSYGLVVHNGVTEISWYYQVQQVQMGFFLCLLPNLKHLVVLGCTRCRLMIPCYVQIVIAENHISGLISELLVTSNLL